MDKYLAKCFTLIIVFAGLVSIAVKGQHKIELSKKHKAKIEKALSPKKKLKLYKKFYKKDSMRWVRSWNKKLKQQSDSLYAATQQKMRLRQEKLKDTVESRLERIEGLPDRLLQKSDSRLLKDQAQKFNGDLQEKVSDLDITNSTENLKGKTGSMDKLKEVNGLDKMAGYTRGLDDLKEVPQKQLDQTGILREAKEYGNKAKSFNQEITEYRKELDHLKNGDLNKLDKGTQVLEQKIIDRAEFKELQEKQAFAREMRETPMTHKKEVEQMADQKYIKDRAMSKAKEKAVELFTKNDGILKEAQKKLTKLKKKYSSVQNSNDLSTAVKRSSLKGKPFKERFIIGTNFQVLSHKPFAVDFSPVIGYRFNKKFSGGLGGTFQRSYGKDTKAINIPKNAHGFRTFMDYNVAKSLFAYLEYACNREETVDPVSEASKKNWESELNIGLGKWMSFLPKVKASMLFLYNVMPMEGLRFYEKPIEVRFGFQLVDLDFKKNK